MARSKSLTETAILSLLEIKPMYGVEMVEEIKRLSGGVIVMPLPTLYSALHKLSVKKYVNSYWQEAEVGGRRHFYNITQSGRDYYTANKFEIHYEELKETVQPTQKTFTTLEEAFSLPLTNQAAPLPADKRILQPERPLVNIPTSQPVNKTPAAPKKETQITPYLLPTDKIMSSENTHKQLSINLTGTAGETELRPLEKLNSIQAGNDFVIINRLRLFANVISLIIFLGLNFILTVSKTANAGYFDLIFIILLAYFAIVLAIFIVFPRVKAIYTPSKSFKIRALATFILLAAVIIIAIVNKSLELIWLGLYSFMPIIECIIMLILRKGKLFVC